MHELALAEQWIIYTLPVHSLQSNLFSSTRACAVGRHCVQQTHSLYAHVRVQGVRPRRGCGTGYTIAFSHGLSSGGCDDWSGSATVLDVRCCERGHACGTGVRPEACEHPQGRHLPVHRQYFFDRKDFTGRVCGARRSQVVVGRRIGGLTAADDAQENDRVQKSGDNGVGEISRTTPGASDGEMQRRHLHL